jgi:hypothetical protein
MRSAHGRKSYVGTHGLAGIATATMLIAAAAIFLLGYQTKFPVLNDVYYVQTGVDPATKKSSSVLVKRGKELHSPDRMYLNPSQIVLVEPVGPDSKVAQLIAESKAKGQ